MFDKLVNFIVFQIVDKKRIAIAVLALVNLVRPTLAQFGVEIPEAGAVEFSSWAAIAVLAVWSKLNARKAEVPSNSN